MSYRFDRSGRRPVAALVVAGVWATLLAGKLWLDLSPVVVGILLALTLPAVFDFATARPAGLSLDDRSLRWHSGRHRGEVRLDNIDHLRFETRLDMSLRVRLVLKGPARKRLTVPQDALPPAKALQEALEAHGLRVQRHPFALL